MSPRVVKIQGENFKKLKAISFRPTGPVTKITGRNAQGKSSTLDLIEWLIGGGKHAPAEPIRKGQEECKGVLELDTHIVKRRRYKADDGTEKDSVTVEIKETKAKVSSPQTKFLDALMGEPGFDALNFSRLKPADQAKLLREITGLDTSALDDERRDVFAQRTAVNKQVATLKGKLDGMDPPDTERPEIVAETDVSAFVAEMEAASKIKAHNDACRTELDRIKTDIAKKDEERARLVAELERVKGEATALLARMAKGQQVVDKLTDPDISDIKLRLAEAEATNATIRREREARAEADRKANEYDVLKFQLTEQERIAKSHTARLNEIDKERAAALEKCVMPVDGLSIDGDAVTLGGVPFEQASSKQKIIAGLEIALSLNPELRVCLIRDGSLLDDDALTEVEAWAAEKDAFVFMECVGKGIKNGIEIEDGEIVK